MTFPQTPPDNSQGWQQPVANPQTPPWQQQPAAPAAPHGMRFVQAPQQPQAPLGPQPPVQFVVPAQTTVSAPAPAPSYDAPVYDVPMPSMVQARQSNTMATAITLIALVVGLWGALGYLHSTVRILGGITTSSNQILTKMRTSQTGLAQLQAKTAQVKPMAASARVLSSRLTSVDDSMGAMLQSVDSVSASMQAMNRSVGTLDTSLDSVNAANASLATSLGAINSGLGKQAAAVHAMKRDVVASSTGLATLPSKLAATGARLKHINGAVCTLGTKGVASPTSIHIGFLGLNTGGATIAATLIPAGGWTC